LLCFYFTNAIYVIADSIEIIIMTIIVDNGRWAITPKYDNGYSIRWMYDMDIYENDKKLGIIAIREDGIETPHFTKMRLEDIIKFTNKFEDDIEWKNEILDKARKYFLLNCPDKSILEKFINNETKQNINIKKENKKDKNKVINDLFIIIILLSSLFPFLFCF
jgi:hypothetical protein